MVLFWLWALGSGLTWNGCDVDGSEVTPRVTVSIFRSLERWKSISRGAKDRNIVFDRFGELVGKSGAGSGFQEAGKVLKT